jgi:hypothetical protein
MYPLYPTRHRLVPDGRGEHRKQSGCRARREHRGDTVTPLRKGRHGSQKSGHGAEERR